MSLVHIGLAALAMGWGRGVTLYVSPTGSDGWSGRLAAANAARTDGPFATPGRARDALRAMRRSGALGGPAIVELAGGVYRLGTALRLTAEDSGTADAPVVFRARAGARVTLSGERTVGGWRRSGGGVFTTELWRQGFGDVRFRELFEGGARQTLARTPNRDPAHPETGGFLYVDAASSNPRTSFHYRPRELPAGFWRGTRQAEVVIWPYNCWDHNIIRVGGVDPAAARIDLRDPVAGRVETGNRYYVQNARTALDAPGEWYCDWSTGRLSFIPPDGRAPADGSVSAPMLENVAELSGTPDAPVRWVTLQGLTLEGARQDGITVEGARDCAIVACTVRNVGGVGVNLGYVRNAVRGVGLPRRARGAVETAAHSGDRALIHSHPCTAVRVAGCDIGPVGGDGVAVAGDGNRVENCHISRVGIYDRVCAGITLIGDGNRAGRNTIHDIPRDGIFINGKLNVAEYNDIRHAMLHTADNAAIALRQHNAEIAARCRGNVLRFNRILDTVGYGSYLHCVHPGTGYAGRFCSFGIYLDSSISGVQVYGNLVARTGAAGIFIQFGGDNTVENNIFFEDARRRIQYDAMVFFGTFMFADAKGAIRASEPPNRIRRNIFAFGSPETALYRVGHWDNPPTWNRRQAEFGSNLIWHGGRDVLADMHDTLRVRRFAEWQALGFDAGSKVADPGFVDPARNDFRLRSGSPAYAVGFRDIAGELARAGCHASAERASWPLREATLPLERPVEFRFAGGGGGIVDGFERAAPGGQPAGAQVAAQAPASALVAGDVAHTGRRCLRFVDAQGLRNPWEPHAYWHPNLASGRLHFSAAILNDAREPADLYMEVRDWRGALRVGPTFRVDREGGVWAGGPMGAGGERIGSAPTGRWFTVAMEFGAGRANDGFFTIRLAAPGQAQVVRRVRVPDAKFSEAQWFGISSMSDGRATFHVDDLVLGPSDSARVRGAAGDPAVRGVGGPGRAPAAGPDGLAGAWRMDDAGFSLADSSGHELGGAQGGAGRAEGAFGRALFLDGGGGVATVPDSPLLQFGMGSFTLEAWVLPTRLAIDSEHQRRRLIGKDAWPATWWDVDIQTDGRVMMDMADDRGGIGTTTSAGRLAEGAWTHLLIAVDRASRTTTYYLNGRADSRAAHPPAFAGALDVAGRPVQLGAWQPFVGAVSDLRMWRRALTAEEAARRFAAGEARHRSARFTPLMED